MQGVQRSDRLYYTYNPTWGFLHTKLEESHVTPFNPNILPQVQVFQHLRPLKEEIYRVRITVGGDRLTYNDDAGSPAANLLETKLLINSTISDAAKGARFMTADIKDHFLATPMEKPEYMKVPYKYFPEDIRQHYNLSSKVTSSGHIYIKN